MSDTVLEPDAFIHPAVGAEISYHAIVWEGDGEPATIPAGGNIHHHRLPAAGTAQHTHEFGEVVLVLSGAVTHHVNGSRQLLPANTVVFVRPSDRHRFLPAPKAPPCELLFLSFHVDFFHALGRYLEEPSFLERYTAGVLPATFAVPEARMNELSRELLTLNSGSLPPVTRKLRMKAVLLDLFVRFFLDDGADAARTTQPAWFRELCDLMRAPENFIAGVARMQRLSGYAPSYLSRVFRKHLALTPTDFVNALRMDHAARRLADTDEPILSIALAIGCQSLSRFYHLFKKRHACAPADYRRRARAARQLL